MVTYNEVEVDCFVCTKEVSTPISPPCVEGDVGEGRVVVNRMGLGGRYGGKGSDGVYTP